MSANLNELNGTVSYVENARREIAWHGLGQRFDRPLSAREILEMPNFSYQVEKGHMLHIPESIVEAIKQGMPLDIALKDISAKDIIKSHKCTYRSDTNDILGVVRDTYEVVQNKEGFDFIDNITGANGENPLCDGAVIETAGVLGKGERFFVTAKLPGNIRVGDSKEEVTDYILFTNSHDGSSPVTALFTPIRVVCNNTLNAALKHAQNKYTFKHTKKVLTKLGMAEQVMQVHKLYKEAFEGQMTALYNKTIDDDTVQDLVAKVFMTDEQFQIYNRNNRKFEKEGFLRSDKEETIKDVIEYVHTGVGQEFNQGTAYWLYNGLTSYYNNERPYKDEMERFTCIMKKNDTNKSQAMLEELIAL